MDAARLAGRRVAVVGAGWAGLAAAVRAAEAGAAVTVFEMAARPGGRARSVEDDDGRVFDNGQHILIGAYARTLALMHTVGVDPAHALRRLPLVLRYPDGRGLEMPAGPPAIGFARAVLGACGWGWRDRASLLAVAAGWAARRFRCDEAWTVDRLAAGLTPAVRELLIDPLCVAALNTPATEASASVMLRVLRDALFGGRGSADLLLPRRPLGNLVPEPAVAWLRARGHAVHAGRRVRELAPDDTAWRVDGERFDRIVLATPPAEAARLTAALAPAWSARAAALEYEPIVTVYLDAPGARLPAPMTALVEGDEAPAQFAFDHGALGGPPGRLAFVVSGARRWTERGLAVTGEAVRRQALAAFPEGTWMQPPVVARVLADKRATFRCTPRLARTPARVMPGLVAAGDHVQGPYPATLEGAVRSGEAAVALLAGDVSAPV